MNLVQEIQTQITGIPTDIQAEILDFIKFVKQQRRVAKTTLFPPSRLEEVAGCLAYQGTAKRVEDMDAALAAQFRREWQS